MLLWVGGLDTEDGKMALMPDVLAFEADRGADIAEDGEIALIPDVLAFEADRGADITD